MAAAPLAITDLRRAVVDFSKVWANVSLAMVTHVDNGLDNVTLVLDSPHSLGCVDGGATYNQLKGERDPPYTKIWSKIESDPESKVKNVSDGVERAREGNYTLIVESQFADYIVNKHCELRIVHTFLPQEGYAFALTKGSNLKVELDKGIQKMIDDGSLARIRRKWWDVPCVSGQPQAARPLDLALYAVALAICLLKSNFV